MVLHYMECNFLEVFMGCHSHSKGEVGMYTRGYKVLFQLLNYHERGNATFGRLQGMVRVQGLWLFVLLQK
jgi:hypothetical protein